MTVALSLKVHDGIVLAADSASTLAGPNGVVNIYNNANKITNLRKGFPIGAITWGLGSIGRASISTLLKDLRVRLTNQQVDDVEKVAQAVKEFLYDEQWLSTYGEGVGLNSELGVLVAGYSAAHPLPVSYSVVIDQEGQCHGPTQEQPEEQSGVAWYGQIEAIHRLLHGYSSALEQVLVNDLGVPDDQVAAVVETIHSQLSISLVQDAMPLQDAIDLAEDLVALAISYSRFSPFAPTVGGPIEIAAITKHEGFKWVKRKHYYSREYNPPIKET